MKFVFLILIFILFLTFFGSVKANVWIYPTNANIYVDDVTYTTSQPINFTYIEIGSTYAIFNYINLTISSTSSVTIEIEEISNHSLVKNQPLIKFNATATNVVTFNLDGFAGSVYYELYVDDNFYYYLQSSSGGTLTFSYLHFSKHTFAIFGLLNYSFQIRYENYSQGIVNLSRWGPHQFIVQYSDKREENWIQDRVFIHNETNFSMYDFYNGSFNISIDSAPLWFEFHWNDTNATSSTMTTTERFYGYPKTQNTTTTYIQLDYVPINYGSINVTCYNDTVPKSESYPNFVWNSYDTITIYPYQANEFYQINVTYSYTLGYSSYRCNRIQVANYSDRNVTFYIYTNKKIYGESTTYFNNSLVRYTYDFEDKTGIFINQPDPGTYAYVYTFTPNGTQMLIHSEYWDTSDKIFPMLLYEKEYFIGVSCPDLTIDRIGIAPTSSNLNPVIIINYFPQQFYSIGDIFIIRQGWMAPPTGCYVYYQDTVGELNSVAFYLYNYSNLSLAHQSYSTAIFDNFTYPTACQRDVYYWLMIINHSYWSTNQTISGIIFSLNESMVNASYLNQIINLTLGYTPFRNVDTGQEIPWVYALIFGVFFTFLVSFAIINAYGAVTISGIWLMFSGVFFHNFPAVGLLGAGMLITAGCFLVILAVLAALGGYGQK